MAGRVRSRARGPRSESKAALLRAGAPCSTESSPEARTSGGDFTEIWGWPTWRPLCHALPPREGTRRGVGGFGVDLFAGAGARRRSRIHDRRIHDRRILYVDDELLMRLAV